MVELDWHVLLLQAISFGITMWVVKLLAWKPLLNHIASRSEAIRSDYEKAEHARLEMEDLVRQYNERINQADQSARERINAAMKRGEQRAEEIVSAAQEEAKAIAQRSREEIERERQKVLADLRNQVAHLSIAIASKIIDEHLDEQKHRALVDDYISRLGSMA